MILEAHFISPATCIANGEDISHKVFEIDLEKKIVGEYVLDENGDTVFEGEEIKRTHKKYGSVYVLKNGFYIGGW